MPRTTCSELARLVPAARRDLDDGLVALVVLAREAKRADDAMSTLLDARAAEVTESVVDTHEKCLTLKQGQRRYQ